MFDVRIFSSRKFLVTIGTLGAFALSQALGWDVSSEAGIAVAALVATYVFGQGMVDKEKVKQEGQMAVDEGLRQLTLYAQGLEKQLQNLYTDTLEEAATAEITE